MKLAIALLVILFMSSALMLRINKASKLQTETETPNTIWGVRTQTETDNMWPYSVTDGEATELHVPPTARLETGTGRIVWVEAARVQTDNDY